MKAKRNKDLFYVIPAFLLISACIWINSSSGAASTPAPFPSDTPTAETMVTSEPTASPTVVPGSFAEFYLFAGEIATALQDKNTGFFDEYAKASVWNCLGDETFGICKEAPADSTLEGIPVTYDWATYEVHSREDYSETWQTRFDNDNVLELVAAANQLGDNPLMPMAGQSFLAIVSVADESNPSTIDEVRVLFFEYYEQTWHLRGELVTTEHTDAWLKDACPTCYDVWAAWQK